MILHYKRLDFFKKYKKQSVSMKYRLTKALSGAMPYDLNARINEISTELVG